MKITAKKILTEARFDANETAFTLQQLEYVEEQTYDILYSKLKSAEFVPFDLSTPEWAETWSYEEWDEVGMAEVISNYTDALPLVDVLVKKYTHRLFDIGDAYHWTIRDLKVSAKLKQPLDTARSIAARNAIERKIDVIVATGEPSLNTKGFINSTAIPVATLPNGSWATATPDEIVEDLFYIENEIIVNSDENHEPTDIILPTAAYGIVTTRRMGDGSDTTILKYFLANCQSVKTVSRWKKLNTAGVGNTTRIVCYEKNPLNMKFKAANLFEQLEPEKRNLAYFVDCLARVGGVCVYRPLAHAFGDGV